MITAGRAYGPEQVVHLVLTRGKTSRQRAHRLLARPVEFGEMAGRRGLVIVVVVDVQAGSARAALGDEVDQLGLCLSPGPGRPPKTAACVSGVSHDVAITASASLLSA